MEVPREFQKLDVYKVLNIDKDCDQAGVKKAYLRRALVTHPDKVGDTPENQLKFQEVVFAYSVLSDPTRRSRYDKTGSLADTESLDFQETFSTYYNIEITEDMIEEDKKLYRSSGDERADLLRYYEYFKGDFDAIFESVLHATESDRKRLIKVLEKAIEKKELKEYSKFAKTTRKSHVKKRAKSSLKEAKEADKLRKKLNVKKTNSEQDLAALIQARGNQRNQRFNNFLDQLEQQYAQPSRKSRK